MREFLNTTAGKVTALTLVVIGVAVGAFQIWQGLGPSEAGRISRERLFICSETGKTFEYALKEGDRYPVKSPYSGNQTGYPAELCYWTKDGKPKETPTAILLNSWVGKKEPTFCPDCGRLVVGHNPPASADRRPPPTQAEYRPRQGADR